MIPYANSIVYGPYTRKDGRMHLVVVFPNRKKSTVSYPKYLVETSIGQYLNADEVVHHIDGNPNNNKLDNLEIVNRSSHTRLHVKKRLSKVFCCPVCGELFSLNSAQLHDVIQNRRKGKSKTGPYCSKSCAGIGSNVRIEISDELVTLLSFNDENH